MPDVPIALVQLSRPPSSSVLAITYNQLYTINSWSVNPGDISADEMLRNVCLSWKMRPVYCYWYLSSSGMFDVVKQNEIQKLAVSGN